MKTFHDDKTREADSELTLRFWRNFYELAPLYLFSDSRTCTQIHRNEIHLKDTKKSLEICTLLLQSLEKPLSYLYNYWRWVKIGLYSLGGIYTRLHYYTFFNVNQLNSTVFSVARVHIKVKLFKVRVNHLDSFGFLWMHSNLRKTFRDNND